MEPTYWMIVLGILGVIVLSALVMGYVWLATYLTTDWGVACGSGLDHVRPASCSVHLRAAFLAAVVGREGAY